MTHFVRRLFDRWSTSCDMRCVVHHYSPRQLFIYVHGNLVDGAQRHWTDGSSLISKSLKKAFPECQILSFDWSGVNGAARRIDSSKALYGEIVKLQASYPDVPIVTIAHSHGGNIVTGSSTLLGTRLSAAIHMNTPFVVQINQRSDHDVSAVVILGMFIITCCLIGIIVYSNNILLAHLVSTWWRNTANILVFGLISILCLGSTLMTAPAITKAKRVALLYAEPLRSFIMGTPQIDRQFVIVVAGDEPSAALSAHYGLRWAVSWLGWKALPLVVVSGAVSFPLFGWFELNRSMAFLVIAGLGVAYILPIVFLGLALLGFGLTLGLASILFDVVVAQAPIGRTEMLHVRVEPTDDRPLRHYPPCEDETVRGDIVRWLQSFLTTQPSNARCD